MPCPPHFPGFRHTNKYTAKHKNYGLIVPNNSIRLLTLIIRYTVGQDCVSKGEIPLKVIESVAFLFP